MRWIVSPETSLNIVLKIKTRLNHRGPLFYNNQWAKIVHGVNLQIYLEEGRFPLWHPYEIIPLLWI